ncbi:MAG: polyprenyl synthetase family protein, partial [Acidobacteria bacterium]|nr:polyprenyl synthetase family protein [Acidobacteriota bacterium]
MAVRGSSAVLAAADLPLRAAVVTAPGAAPAPGRLLDDERLAEVRRGFTDLLAVGPHLEPHLKGVLDDTLQHPGSLLRAQLAYGLLLDGGADPETSLELAVAIEYFHTASLLLDDLPAMDDGLLRRGQPCAHRVHGEGAAILGALGLITRAYALLWQGIATLEPERRRIAGGLVEECLGV